MDTIQVILRIIDITLQFIIWDILRNIFAILGIIATIAGIYNIHEENKSLKDK